MNIKKEILFILLTSVYSILAFGQSTDYKTYTYNSNDKYNHLNFSFDIPQHWTIDREYDGTGYFLNCKPTNDSDTVNYNDCFDGIAFRIKYLRSNLDSALLTMGLQKQSDRVYTTLYEGNIKIEFTTDIKGETYNGLYYTINNDIRCKSHNSKVAGHFQFIYFSDGKQTVCIATNGRSFDETIFKQIIDSFKFIN